MGLWKSKETLHNGNNLYITNISPICLFNYLASTIEEIEELPRDENWIPTIFNVKNSTSRAVGKTYWTAEHILLDKLIIDERVSFYYIGLTKTEHSTKGMLWVEEALKRYGFEEEIDYRKIDTQTTKRIYFYANGRNQVIHFIGLDETNSAGAGKPDGPDSFFASITTDELTEQLEANKTDFEEKEVKLRGIDHLRGSIIRHLPKGTNFITISNFNGANELDPLLKNDYLNVDKGGIKLDREILENKGFQYKVNNNIIEIGDTKFRSVDFFGAGNFQINNTLQPIAKAEYYNYKNISMSYYLIYAIGLIGTPTKSFLVVVLNEVMKYQIDFIHFNFRDCIDFRFGQDVGNGGAPHSLVLEAYNTYFKCWIPIKEYEVNKKDSWNKYDADKTALSLVKKIIQWGQEIQNLKTRNYDIPYTIDNDMNFKSLLKNAFDNVYAENDPKWQLEYPLEINVFLDKYEKDFARELRPIMWEYALTSKRIMVFEQLTPQLFNGLKQAQIDKQGKFIKDNYSHIIEAAEMSNTKELKNVPHLVKKLIIDLESL